MRPRRRLSILALVAALALAGAALAAPPIPPRAAPAAPHGARSLDLPEGTLVAAGPAADLEILFTGDVIGYIEPCG
jgi:hypothetical protein